MIIIQLGDNCIGKFLPMFIIMCFANISSIYDKIVIKSALGGHFFNVTAKKICRLILPWRRVLGHVARSVTA